MLAISAAKDHDVVLFTLRHGESLGQKNINAYKALGDDALPITKLGVRQSIAAGKLLAQACYMAGIPKVDMRTSTGERSSTTAELMYEFMNGRQLEVSLQDDVRLDKQKFGAFDGYFTSAEREANAPEAYARYMAEEKPKGEFYARPPGGESIADVRDRIRLAINDYVQSPIPVIAVSHGTNTLCAEDVLLHRGEDWVLQGLDKRPNCSIHMIYGSPERGYRAQIIADDPLLWAREFTNQQPRL